MKSAIHHITAICSDPKKNFDFYTKVLGLRFTKKTVNFDDPYTYHLYYGNESGEPGTALTFFPFADIGYGRRGTGQVTKIQFSIPKEALGFWVERFVKYNVKHESISKSFGNSVIKFFDPDDLQLELVTGDFNKDILPWTKGDIEQDYAIRGFFGAELSVEDFESSYEVLEQALSYTLFDEENAVKRLKHKYSQNACFIDILELQGWPSEIQGYGTVHHIAFSAKDDEHQEELRGKILDLGLNTTNVIDRKYFHSIYFREPSNVLFEIATYNPGFTVDEDINTLGTHLKLPAQYEGIRSEIERFLPELDTNSHEMKGMSSDKKSDLFKYLFIPKSNDLIVAFHGTGADENDLVPLVEDISSQNSILSLRGNVTQNGARRFFIRNADGTFDLNNIETEVEKFGEFYSDFISKNDNFFHSQIAFLGYSNGANFILNILFQNPEIVENAILLHPMFVYQPKERPDLSGKKILVTTGLKDEYLRSEDEIEQLVGYLKSCGADVETFQSDYGHQLVEGEIEWLKSNLKK